MKNFTSKLTCFFFGALLGSTIAIQAAAQLTVEKSEPQAQMSAVLPAENIEKTIKNLKIGESGYTLTWGMWVDLNGRCWLNPDYPVTEEIKGTSRMLVFRNKDGYCVGIASCSDARWTKTDRPSFVGQNGPWIPVVSISQDDG